MKAALGQSVIVENRAGASGMIAAAAVAKSPPDGLTLLMAASGEVAINQHLYKDKMSYDPPRELVAVALIGIVPCVVVVAAGTPVRTAAELIAYARANRGRLSFSSSGIGNPQQLAGELMNSMAGTEGCASSGAGSNQHVLVEWFAQMADIKLDHVPYRGAGQAINDLIAGHVRVAFLGPTALIPHYKSGNVRLLAQSSERRSPNLPEVPTL